LAVGRRGGGVGSWREQVSRAIAEREHPTWDGSIPPRSMTDQALGMID
jgi:hypothetical protein